MSTWLIQAIVKGVLNWLKSLWDSFIQKQKHIEQGRQEVIDQVAAETEKFKEDVKKISETNSDLTVDDITRRLRERFHRTAGVSGTTPSTPGSN